MAMLRNSGLSYKKIADIYQIHPSTVHRLLDKNAYNKHKEVIRDYLDRLPEDKRKKMAKEHRESCNKYKRDLFETMERNRC